MHVLYGIPKNNWKIQFKLLQYRVSMPICNESYSDGLYKNLTGKHELKYPDFLAAEKKWLRIKIMWRELSATNNVMAHEECHFKSMELAIYKN